MTRSGICFAMVVLAVGCGSTTLVPSTGTATFTGALTGSVTVTAVGSYSNSSSQLGFGIDSTGSAPTLVFGMVLPGTSLATGTYNSANVLQADTEVQATTASSELWTQVFDPSQSASNQGTFSVTLTSAGTEIDNSTGKGWISPHGTFTATLPPQPGSTAAGTVNVSVTF